VAFKTSRIVMFAVLLLVAGTGTAGAQSKTPATAPQPIITATSPSGSPQRRCRRRLKTSDAIALRIAPAIPIGGIRYAIPPHGPVVASQDHVT
jgi:hypothetical protein